MLYNINDIWLGLFDLFVLFSSCIVLNNQNIGKAEKDFKSFESM